jgi:hypothetical protein
MENREPNNLQEPNNPDDLKEMFRMVIGASTEEDVEDTQNALNLKYGCEFTATHIGNRIDSDTSTLYLLPDFDESLVVKAVIDAESREVSDNLIDRLAGRSFSKELNCTTENIFRSAEKR